MARRWTINGRFLSQPTTGVQRYAREVVRALDTLLAEQNPLTRGLELALLHPPGSGDFPLACIERREIGGMNGHAWEQVQLPSSLDGSGLLSLCNTGPLLSRKHIVCVHDANVWNAPQSYSFAFRLLYRNLLPALGKTACGISTVSNYSLDELVRRDVIPAERAFVAPNGHEHALRWEPEHSAQTRLAASRETVVLIGSTAPHKNLDLLLNMADRLGEAGLRIAIVGMSDSRVFRSGSARTEARNIHWLGRISDGELAALLGDSLCLAFPSLTEGFGLPALEAMAVGCPVVVSDRASLPEVCGNAALFASPDDQDAWFDSFVQLRTSQALRAQMMGKGKARAAEYSWRATGLRYLQAMAAADGVDTETKIVRAPEFT
ncbi:MULTISPECIES: glycosyltransferase family 1 protein [Mesorhizobium]|uniref:glycosyltransferase family 4 protein n=1 Tax=Mesorhizobium TaxID=68287 RepID=UPI0007A95125|nr:MULTISPECIES: glycosyltransferase family 1 protein [Mesorhizobium]AMX98087.1 glycosyl transferase [Mesorhizobium ciceri]MDF3233688.1 glycosyltransferase family 1 protein [Mesorhizobium sp. DSM 30133]RUU15912.1 glycosyltransferase family 1 protein [Mesorhizobium sp. Primo-B]RUU33787.1 glycosyltransferase family 1 protein [Mesorhizobium sp. Primo-A]RVB82941.1 glycosyltransferase family 1 protein [Mesorhizobium sp. M7A.F.Ca.AU.002.03.1.1]